MYSMQDSMNLLVSSSKMFSRLFNRNKFIHNGKKPVSSIFNSLWSIFASGDRFGHLKFNVPI